MNVPLEEDQEPTAEQEEEQEDPGYSPKADFKAEIHNNSVENQTNIHIHPPGGQADPGLESLADEMPSLPLGLHPFQDPRHDILRGELERRRILLLSSYQERAAYAAAHSLASDGKFLRQKKRALSPARIRDKERSDLDLSTLVREEFLSKEPQIILVEIQNWCTFLDSATSLNWQDSASVCDRLERHSSYLVLAVSEDLLPTGTTGARLKDAVPCYSVSHLRYLLSGNPETRKQAEKLEARLLASFEKNRGTMDLEELYHRVARQLAAGFEIFEHFLRELEGASSLPFAQRLERLQPVRPQEILRADTEMHRAVVFTATYLPDLGQGDFDRVVLTLLGDQVVKEERARQRLDKDGEVVSVIEEVTERWAERWQREPDQVFAQCHLRTVRSAEGSWVVDFTEPYLRREMRNHFESQLPWYVRRQCQVLQSCGALFSFALSTATVQGLVRLFVDRALVDPSGFGSRWLLDLVQGLRIQLKEPTPEDDPEEVLIWILKKAVVEPQLRGHFHGRLALLIREMLDQESLRPVVGQFFEFLIALRQHEALLDLVFDLARRLRFAPYFDPLLWMRRLLDQGSDRARRRVAERLVNLARESGTRIYDVFKTIQRWLPEDGRPAGRYSVSHVFALEFPFTYCLAVSRSLNSDHLGVWPSRHPLFYALPEDPADARARIAGLLGWVLDPRGIGLEKGDPKDPTRTAKFVRMEQVAALVEHWAWVLEGAGDTGPAEGKEVFRIILEELNLRLGETERLWIQRIWQRRQDEYLQKASRNDDAAFSGRRQLVAQREKLTQLRMQLAALAGRPVS